MRLIVRWSMGLVALAAASLSYQSLMYLALLCGYGRLAWVFPLVVDLGAAASCAAWLRDRARQALVMTWSLLITSVLLNATTHYLASTGSTPSWPLAVAVAAVPPTVLGMTVHLAVGLGERDHHGLGKEPRPGQSGGAGAVSPGAVGSGAPHSVDRDSGRGGLEVGDARHGVGENGAVLPTLDRVAQIAGGHGQRAGVSRPGRPHESEESGEPTTPGVWGSNSEATSGANPISQLIESGAGRRKIAAELGVSEHRARVMLNQHRNGDGP